MRNDSKAYAMQRLLPIIIDDHDDNKFRSHAIVLRDWKMVGDSRANSKRSWILMRSDRRYRIEQTIQRPIIRYQNR